MLKQVRIGLLATLVLFTLASCQNSSNDVRDEARQAIENAVQPVDPAASMASEAMPEVPAGPTTEMTFEETTFDFGTITDGEKVSHDYKFKNTGKEPLILSDAKGSCGCTVPKWPREPIPPGGSATITVEFDSKGKQGKKDQKVTITANTNPPQSFLHLTGEVLPGAGSTPQITQ